MLTKNTDHEAIKKEYVETEVTIRELSEKYGVPSGTLYKRCAAEKWRTEKLKNRATAILSEVVRNEGDDEASDGEKDLDPSAVKSVLSNGIESRKKLTELRKISEILTKKISEAVFDEFQFNRYLVSEKGTDENGKAVTYTHEKCFDKLDTKALKEMSGALKVLTECVRSLYGIPTFGETTRLYLAGRAEDDEGEEPITVSFLDGEEFSG